MNNFFLFSLTHALSLTRTCMYASHTHIHRSIITRARDRDRQPLLSTAFFGLPSLSPFRRTSSRQLRRDRLPCTHHMTHTAKESARAHTHTHTHTNPTRVSDSTIDTSLPSSHVSYYELWRCVFDTYELLDCFAHREHDARQTQSALAMYKARLTRRRVTIQH